MRTVGTCQGLQFCSVDDIRQAERTDRAVLTALKERPLGKRSSGECQHRGVVQPS